MESYRLTAKERVAKEDFPEWKTFNDDRVEKDCCSKEMKGYFYYVKDELVGYFMVSYNNKYYTLDYFEVHPDKQKMGIGTFLLDKVKSMYAEFLIEAVPGSYHFYLSRGAKPVYTHSGGVVLFISQRSITSVANNIFGEDDPSCCFKDDFVYNREEWEFYDETD